jgi:hypothetical protein
MNPDIPAPWASSSAPSVRSDGSERWISSHITVLKDETGNPTRLIGTALDVTARKAAKAELQYRKTLLEAQSEAALDAFSW